MKKLIQNLDLTLLLIVAILLAFGLVVLWSATAGSVGKAQGDPLLYVKRQSVWVLVGIALMIAICSVDYNVLGHYYRLIYAGTLAGLVLVLVFGRSVSGTQGWFRVGSVGIQPAEFAKIGVIITLAKHLDKKDGLDQLTDLISPFVHVGIPMLLILKQPDFGTAMVFIGILFGMLFMAGADHRHLLATAGAGMALFSAAVFLSVRGIVPILAPHQISRILVFFDPYSDRTGAGWNVIQSMIAIGSGGLFGKGLLRGTQAQLNFLPAHHTDFIFSVVGEELGFMGSFILLVLYVLLLWRGLKIMVLAKDDYGANLAAGVVSMLLFHLVINIGMTLGVMPVTGIPLPFISYGGSSLLTNMAGIGLLFNVYMRRRKIMFK
ncbi:MAG TPA: rod shape-determining protein RodA [Firmicutes bacterium]|nr:rod shape-determining protein RodA [Bacillota bacterium]